MIPIEFEKDPRTGDVVATFNPTPDEVDALGTGAVVTVTVTTTPLGTVCKASAGAKLQVYGFDKLGRLHIRTPPKITAGLVDDAKPTRCDECRFWMFDGHTSGPRLTGECRRLSPAPIGSVRAWPQTNAIDWCGEFKPR